MKTYTIQIKNMECPRCIYVVKQILNNQNIKYENVDLGYAVLASDQFLDLDGLDERLNELELGLVRDSNQMIVTEIKKVVHEYLNKISQLGRKHNLSEYISQQLARNYHQLSKIFSQYGNETIEQYFIGLRTNKVKELIKQGKLNLSQIAVDVGYSSIHYLSGQFKKFTGMSLTEYKMQWESSLLKVSSNGQGQKNLELIDVEGLECDCGCQDCDCEEENGSVGGEFNPRSRRIDRNEPSIYSRPYSLQNFGEYLVHISA